MTTEQPEAGWYPDPAGKPGQMYWDGQQWHTNVPATTSGFAPQAGAAYGLDAYGRPLSDKSKLVAGLLQIFLPSFGIGRFYLGYTNIALLQIAASFLTCGIGIFWPFIDGILIITGKVPDPQGRTLRE